jgi:molybdenum cofactor guanylyltransferase
VRQLDLRAVRLPRSALPLRSGRASVGGPPLAEPVTGILLAGGASRRFGSPKALATLGGTTLAERAWHALDWCDERIAVGKHADALPLPFPIVDDGSAVRAPLAGLVAGLRAASNELCVVLPVDCPSVTAGLLRRLAAAAAPAAVPQTGPLPGAYRRTLLPVLARRLADGDLRLWGAVDAVTVDCDPAELVNVNTEAELRALGPR